MQFLFKYNSYLNSKNFYIKSADTKLKTLHREREQ